MRAMKRRFCSSCPTSSHLDQARAAVNDELLDNAAELEKAVVLLGRAEAHHVLDACAIVSTAVEDHDLTAVDE